MKKFLLELDEYEASNLFWLLSLIYKNDLPIFKFANTGDWVGQLYWRLHNQDPLAYHNANITEYEMKNRIKHFIKDLRKNENDWLKDFLDKI